MSTDTPAVDEAAEHLGDALFTYCLSVLCDQDEALTAVREVKQLAIRHGRRLCRQELQRAWLYALARYVCLVRLERGGLTPVDAADPAAHPRLARLAWPEAAGTTPEQRELLELTGRHQLDVPELAAVLDLRAERAMQLLAEAEQELERTAAALALLAADACPELSRLGRDRGPVLAPALRGELVRHMDACPTCRGAVERGRAEGPWPGTLAAAGTLPLIRVPRRALKMGEGFFARDREPVREPVFDRRGFPVHRTPEEQRALTTRHRSLAGVLVGAAVLTPVGIALALHGAPAGSGEPQAQGPGAGGITGVQVSSPAAVPTASTQPAPLPSGSTTVAAPTAAAPSGPTTSGQGGSGHLGEGVGVPVVAVSSPATRSMPVPPTASAGRLVVAAGQLNGRTVLTLSNPGGSPVSWRATPDASWLRLSRDSGVLAAGAQATVLVTVDDAIAPDGAWTAHVRFTPNGTVVTVTGSGHRRGMPTPSASATTSSPTPTPTATGTSASPTPTASDCPSPTDCPSSSSTPAG